MTAAVTGLTLDIKDDGTVWLFAADHDADGHLYAIERRQVSIEQLRQVAVILGPDATRGVERRLEKIVARLEQRAAIEDAAVQRAREARSRLDAVRAAVTP